MILICRRDIPSNDKEIYFVKWDGYALIGNPDHPDGSLTYHEYFCIHDNLFYRILENNQDSDIKGDSQRHITFINKCQKI